MKLIMQWPLFGSREKIGMCKFKIPEIKEKYQEEMEEALIRNKQWKNSDINDLWQQLERKEGYHTM